MRRRDLLRALAAAAAATAASSCARPDRGGGGRPPGKVRIVLKHQPLWGDPAPFRALLAAFEREAGDVEVVTEPLPNASDVVHQFFLTSLEGGAQDFDVFVVDVVWVPEFARAGWIADLSAELPPERVRRELLPGAAEAVIVDGRTYAMPWYLDVGVLYRRADLVPEPPSTFEELALAALAARAAGAVEHGYVWQGRQYEGLVCNAYEAIWGFGGRSIEAGRLALDSVEARAALDFLRGLITRGASPPSVTSYAEEESRRVFQEGRAAFMRNWPYAWNEAQREGSPVRGKVGLSPLPTAGGEPGYGALGGYQLALNAHAPAWRREAALGLIAHLTSLAANTTMALAYGRSPPRRAAYDDPRLAAEAPLLARLLPMLERARPRPVTPYYPMISDVLQGELSAAVSGVRPAAHALRRAQALVDHLMGSGR